MEDELISYQTAVLAKEKGFNIVCFYKYDRHGELRKPYLENGSSTNVDFRVDLTDLLENYNRYDFIYSVPTQSLLQKYIREKHNIIIEPIYNSTYNYFECVVHDIIKLKTHRLKVYSTYEEALEDGLQYILINLL